MSNNYYTLFSVNLLRFLKAHGIKPISKGKHQNGKNFWVFEVDKKLSNCLSTWTENKKKVDAKLDKKIDAKNKKVLVNEYR